ncbi:hypothetical protein [Dokdonia donghaensis]|uniref:hypothetical protein n=1 Tax=Dokdonia donghaensis TaxID=326320 RepID=UPI0007DDA646|nr:hypothetical protein [Dokdonia donghaensis]ANH60131.1 hypothetical protein I597_1213 [Dokdonia donghaensis DSW-1]
MKTIYLLNKILVSINAFLFLLYYIGLLFLPITGAIQVCCFVYLLFRWSDVAPHLKKYFIIYGVVTVLSLSLLLCLKYFSSLDFLFWLPIILGIALSIYFLILTYKQSEYTLTSQEKDISFVSNKTI